MVMLWPIGIFILIVGAINWQLVLHLNTHVIGRSIDDVWEVLWQLRSTERALFELHRSPFFTPDVYYPQGWYLATGAEPVWWTTALSPLTHLFGPVVVNNLAILACFVAAGATMCLLGVELSRSKLGGILAGCVYISAPILLMRTGGHLHILLSMAWLPLVALWTHRGLQRTGRARWTAAGRAGLFLALSFLGHWQFLLISPLIPISLVLAERGTVTWRQRLSLLATMAIVSLVLVTPFALVTAFARSRTYSVPATFPIAESDTHAASLDRIFTPNPMQTLWGRWAARRFPIRSEGGLVFAGYTAMLMATIGIVSARKRGVAYYVLTGAALILALGPTLHWNDQRAQLAVGGQIGAVLHHVEARLVWPELMPPDGWVMLPLPVALLLRLVPQLLVARVWARYMIVFMLGLGVLAAFGAAFLQGRRRVGHTLVAAAVVLVLLEGLQAPYILFSSASVNARTVDAWLARQPKPVTLIEYPFPEVSKQAMYSQSLHGQSVVNGYQSIDPTFYSQAAPTLSGWPRAETVDLLRQWGVQLVLVNGRADAKFQQQVLPAIKAVPGLCWQRKFDGGYWGYTGVDVFRVLQPGETCISGTDG